MLSTARLVPAFLLALALVPAGARATVVVAMDVEDMARLATDVVHGVVQDTQSRHTGGRIFTVVTVKVTERLKAARGEPAQPTVTVTLPGGAVGELAQRIAGAPAYAPGDEVVVFLWRDPQAGALRLLGLSQGSFLVRRPTAGPAEAVSEREGLVRMRREVDGRLVETPGERELCLPLPELLHRVRTEVERPE